MKNLIQEYQENYKAIKKRIYELEQQLKNENLRTKEREHMQARLDKLREEEFEAVCAINEMRKHL